MGGVLLGAFKDSGREEVWYPLGVASGEIVKEESRARSSQSLWVGREPGSSEGQRLQPSEVKAIIAR